MTGPQNVYPGPGQGPQPSKPKRTGLKMAGGIVGGFVGGVLALLMVFGIVGAGGSGSPEEITDPVVSSAPADPSPTEAAPTKSAPAPEATTPEPAPVETTPAEPAPVEEPAPPAPEPTERETTTMAQRQEFLDVVRQTIPSLDYADDEALINLAYSVVESYQGGASYADVVAYLVGDIHYTNQEARAFATASIVAFGSPADVARMQAETGGSSGS